MSDAVYKLIHFKPFEGYEILGEYETEEEANGARRTFRRLVSLGLIETLPPGHSPRYKATQALFDALRAWRNDPKNYAAFQAFELSCY